MLSTFEPDKIGQFLEIFLEALTMSQFDLWFWHGEHEQT